MKGRNSRLLTSVVEAIGNTPTVELSRITSGLEGRIVAKLDYLNPGFSKKDRIARKIIEEAETDGVLSSGQTVVEATSGNTGTGLAIVCAVKGYKFVAVMSKGNSPERAQMMRALGAEVKLVDQAPGSSHGQVSGSDWELVEKATQDIVRERSAFRADQFHLEGATRAHYLNTAREFLEQTNGQIDAFCDFVGTSGTFAGCAAAFKDHDARIRCYLIEPAGAAVLAGKPVTNASHQIQGGGYSMTTLDFLKPEYIDGYIQIDDKTATETTRLLAKKEGIFAGFSSGANVAAAIDLLRGPMRGKTVALVICDSGLKYLSTDLWS
jgi:cysteine synthase